MTNETQTKVDSDSPARPAALAASETADQVASAPPIANQPLQLEPRLIYVETGIGRIMQVNTFGFDASQLNARATPWVITGILQKAGLLTVSVPAHLTSIARSWLVSVLSGGAHIGKYRVKNPVTQAIVLLSQPGPAELQAMLQFLAGKTGAPVLDLHQLSHGNRDVSLVERATYDLIRNRMKPRGSTGLAPSVIHLVVRADQFVEPSQQDAVVDRLRGLQRAGFAVIAYWEHRSGPTWTPPRSLGDTSLIVSGHPSIEGEGAKFFKMAMAWSHFVNGSELPPQVISVRQAKGSLAWKSEDFISDDPDLQAMYRMKAEGATLRQIGAALGIDQSTVSRRLKALSKELGAR